MKKGRIKWRIIVYADCFETRPLYIVYIFSHHKRTVSIYPKEMHMQSNKRNSHSDSLIWRKSSLKKKVQSTVGFLPTYRSTLCSTYNNSIIPKVMTCVCVPGFLNTTTGGCQMSHWHDNSFFWSNVFPYFSHTGLTLCFSLLTEADAGHKEFMDEVYQNETRYPGGDWKPASEQYTDVVRRARRRANVPGGFLNITQAQRHA